MARRPKSPKDMSTVFNSSTGTLAQIKAKTNSLTELANIVRQICPDLPEDAFNISNFINNNLVIEVKSPVWGQRLQFERTHICQALREKTQNHEAQITLKVNPYGHQQTAKKASYARQTHTLPAKTLSNESAQHLLDVASKAPKGLKEKIEKLAKTAKQSSE